MDTKHEESKPVQNETFIEKLSTLISGEPIDLKQQIETVWTLSRLGGKHRMSRLEELWRKHNLQVDATNVATVKVLGSLNDYQNALNGKFYNQKGVRNIGKFKLPQGVRAILGLVQTDHIIKTNIATCENLHIDGVPCIKQAPMYPQLNSNTGQFETVMKPHAITSFTIAQLKTIYQLPITYDGTGQKIGIISLGGGFLQSDVVQLFNSLGMDPSGLQINVVEVGATNQPLQSPPSGADFENALDIQICAAVAPKAIINVYFAPNSTSGFYNAVQTAAMIDNCNIVSISWGLRESGWPQSDLVSFNQLLHTIANKIDNPTTVFAASGDFGSSDGGSGNNVNFPASSPWVFGCGGTTLIATNGNIESETVWNVNPMTSATGGGLSAVFSTPSYQATNSTFPFQGRRGVPDGAANADPNSGWQIVVNGQQQVVGGTSAVSPFYSGMFAGFNQALVAQSKPTVGFMHEVVYPAYSTAFNDILVGNNGAWYAEKYWDPCTGNGSPIGTALLNLFENPGAPIARFSTDPAVLTGETPFTVQFTQTSIGTPTSFEWDFGDGEKTTETLNPVHTFNNNDSGTMKEFTVKLTVTNDLGSSFTTQIVKVTNNYNPNNGTDETTAIIISVVVILVLLVLVAGIAGYASRRGGASIAEMHNRQVDYYGSLQ